MYMHMHMHTQSCGAWKLVNAMGDYIIVGLLIFLSSYQDCAGANSSELCTSLPVSTGMPTPNSTSSPDSSSSGPLLALVIGGGSAVLGATSLLLIMVLLIAICKCKRRNHRPQAVAAVRKATTSRKRSTKASRNGSKSIVNKNHNYETVLPNFSRILTAKVSQAQNYEVPLSQSLTLTRQCADRGEQRGGTFRLQSSEEYQRMRGLAQEPIYMNARTADMHPISPQSTLQSSVVNTTRLGSFSDNIENLDQEGRERERELSTFGESVAI